ncbi:vanillin synthase/trans-feruloyl-CoA hydratase [Chryseolinea serpens]|uniref:Vanillin synthase/trans-feruloyl-CoA hydratase n=1 Tax=Chryseolinea serpens TaxID=947013 RepID=A0A1M5TCV2_9BACT|nr:crotonase/enoyl-CoA hydratase family protein [Chryseolinea serpens]SHH48516.1 vanillin synthase/trans-feruloyl-CoA hydratase [Chryseolinea serpens]
MITEKNLAEKPPIQTEVKEEILLIRLSRPHKRNALNDACMGSLDEVLSNPPSEAKCAIIYAEGKHFCSGMDLSELSAQKDLLEGLKHSRMWHRILDRIQFGSIPVIAVLNGAVLGGGLELASAAHIRVAEKSTFYGLPEGQRGIFVGGGGSVRIPKLIGLPRVMDMMMTGRVYNAEDGMAIGLSQYLVENETGLTQGIELAKKIISNAEATNYSFIHILPRIVDSGQEQGLMMESLIATLTKNMPEAKDRLKLFLDGNAKKVGGLGG